MNQVGSVLAVNKCVPLFVPQLARTLFKRYFETFNSLLTSISLLVILKIRRYQCHTLVILWISGKYFAKILPDFLGCHVEVNWYEVGTSHRRWDAALCREGNTQTGNKFEKCCSL